MQDNPYIAAFAERLAKLREQKGVSAREMSLDLGQAHSAIHGFENKRSFPKMINFFYICDYLGITPKEFFDYDDAAPKQTAELTEEIKKLDGKSREHLLGLIREMNNRPK